MIVAVLENRKSELTDADVTQMHRVTGYVHRHLAQKPSEEDVEQSGWRYSLIELGSTTR